MLTTPSVRFFTSRVLDAGTSFSIAVSFSIVLMAYTTRMEGVRVSPPRATIAGDSPPEVRRTDRNGAGSIGTRNFADIDSERSPPRAEFVVVLGSYLQHEVERDLGTTPCLALADRHSPSTGN